MCGIVYVNSTRNKKVNKIVRKRYYHQQARGKEGFGFVEIGNKTSVIKRSVGEREIINDLNNSSAEEILFHHRWPTSTPNIIEATHPFKITNKLLKYSYILIHNGVITNASELKEEHEKLGFVYQTEIKEYCSTKKQNYLTNEKFNDSEVLAIEFSLYVEGHIDKMRTKGSIAFVCLQTAKNGSKRKLFFARNNGSPLIFDNQSNFWTLSSLCPTRTGEELRIGRLHCYYYERNEFASTDLEFPTNCYTLGNNKLFDFSDPYIEEPEPPEEEEEEEKGEAVIIKVERDEQPPKGVFSSSGKGGKRLWPEEEDSTRGKVGSLDSGYPEEEVGEIEYAILDLQDRLKAKLKHDYKPEDRQEIIDLMNEIDQEKESLEIAKSWCFSFGKDDDK